MEDEVVKGQTRKGPVGHTKESGGYLIGNKGVPLEGIKLKTNVPIQLQQDLSHSGSGGWIKQEGV